MKVGETIEINGVMLGNIRRGLLQRVFFNNGKCPENEDKILLCTIDDIIIFKKI